MRRVRIIVGVAAWVVAGILIYRAFEASAFLRQDEGRRVTTELWQYAFAQRQVVELQWDRPMLVAVGDPIFHVEGPDSVKQVGEIRRIMTGKPDARAELAYVTEAEALLYPMASALKEESGLTYYTTQDSLRWVLETMLPPEKRRQIRDEILVTYEAHRAEILRALKPVIMASFKDAMQVVEQDLKLAVAHHRDQLEQLGTRYQEQLVQQEIIPLIRREIWPIVKQHAEPLANQIGQEMWQRASPWRFGWRMLYDTMPLPQKDLTRKEWSRFLEREGIDVLNRHSKDMITAQQRILADVASDPEVQEAVRRNLNQILDDPEFRTIVWRIIREVLVDNPRLRKTLEAHWQGPEARQAIQLTSNLIEPCARRIGDLLLGTQEEGISPEFARVLRNQIVGKDRRWFVIDTPPGSAALQTDSDKMILSVRRGGNPEINPFAVQLQGGDG